MSGLAEAYEKYLALWKQERVITPDEFAQWVRDQQGSLEGCRVKAYMTLARLGYGEGVELLWKMEMAHAR